MLEWLSKLKHLEVVGLNGSWSEEQTKQSVISSCLLQQEAHRQVNGPSRGLQVYAGDAYMLASQDEVELERFT